MKKVIFSIGIPGSGKSTVLRQFSEAYHYTYICPDDIRGEINQDQSSQANMKLVWETAYSRMKKALQEGQTVVFDSTMAKQQDRENFIKMAAESGAEKIQGLLFETPSDLAHERNQMRDRVVPDFVLDRMQKSLELDPPNTDKGSYSLFKLDREGAITSIQRQPKRAEGLVGESPER